MARGILVFAEQVDGVFRKVAFEIVSEGRRLADTLGEPLTAVVLGSGVENLAETLKKYGADQILVGDDPSLMDYTTDAYTNVLAGIVKGSDPKILLLGASTRGKDLAARLAARLEAGLVTECIALTVQAGELVATKPIFGGKVLAHIAVKGTPQMAAVRPNVLDITEMDRNGSIDKVKLFHPPHRCSLVPGRAHKNLPSRLFG
jgi:electron transfer flavoprotein alpha subunit